MFDITTAIILGILIAVAAVVFLSRRKKTANIEADLRKAGPYTWGGIYTLSPTQSEFAYGVWCIHYGLECGGPIEPALDNDKTWATLNANFDRVNSEKGYVLESGPDHALNIPLYQPTGDCGKFAKDYKYRLYEAGIKSARLAYCRTETGTWHAVCLVFVGDGIVMLDQRKGLPMDWSKAGYTDWRVEWDAKSWRMMEN